MFLRDDGLRLGANVVEFRLRRRHLFAECLVARDERLAMRSEATRTTPTSRFLTAPQPLIGHEKAQPRVWLGASSPSDAFPAARAPPPPPKRRPDHHCAPSARLRRPSACEISAAVLLERGRGSLAPPRRTAKFRTPSEARARASLEHPALERARAPPRARLEAVSPRGTRRRRRRRARAFDGEEMVGLTRGRQHPRRLRALPRSTRSRCSPRMRTTLTPKSSPTRRCSSSRRAPVRPSRRSASWRARSPARTRRADPAGGTPWSRGDP